MILLDSAYSSIRENVLDFPAERGGALMGVRDRPIVSHFLFDETAASTAMTYTPSRELIETIKSVETAQELEFKGILHSHPPGIVSLSHGDEIAIQHFFELNPHKSEMYVPLAFSDRRSEARKSVGAQRPDDPTLEECLVGYRAVRTSRDQVGSGQSSRRYGFPPSFGSFRPRQFEVLEEPISILPVREGACLLSDALAGQSQTALVISQQLTQVRIDHVDLFGYSVVGHGFDVIYLVTGDYPVTGPVVLLTKDGSPSCQVPLYWHYLGSGTAHAIAIADVARAISDSLAGLSMPTRVDPKQGQRQPIAVTDGLR
ncbi:MAG: hypothetical protein JSU08_03575 [Acidobacteria bacterium]|nr:hypothetical protein [Acidobacteriota bacterium]